MSKPTFTKKAKYVSVEGTDCLTMAQAEALLKAATSILMRSDFVRDDTLSPKERNSLDQAWSKLERSIRFAKDTGENP